MKKRFKTAVMDVSVDAALVIDMRDKLTIGVSCVQHVKIIISVPHFFWL